MISAWRRIMSGTSIPTTLVSNCSGLPRLTVHNAKVCIYFSSVSGSVVVLSIRLCRFKPEWWPIFYDYEAPSRHRCFQAFILLLCWGISSTGFPSVSVSISRSQSLFTTPFMAVVRHTSAALAIRSERSAPGLICDLLFEATWLCLEPGLVAMGPEASVSRDRSFGTLCPRTFENQNCRWNVSNLSWKHIYFAMHMPSSAHSAFVTWLRGA